MNLLDQMVGQFETRHGKRPGRIVLSPLALLTLAARCSARPMHQGIPVICREVKEAEATLIKEEARDLGVFVRPRGIQAEIVSCDLK